MDRYQIYESIGSSTHSIVYKARERKTIRFVAVRSTDKSQRQKVVHEVRTMARMQHENVARFFAWFETSNHLWTVTEYCAGGKLLQQDARIVESTVGSFGVDLLAGMQHLHARGVLLVSFDPQKILIDEYGILKLADFAQTRGLPVHGDAWPADATGITPSDPRVASYTAPELLLSRADGGGPHSTASDFWAFGARMPLLYCALQPVLPPALLLLLLLPLCTSTRLPAVRASVQCLSVRTAA
jgi:serine/threonine-protein kinase ULK4